MAIFEDVNTHAIAPGLIFCIFYQVVCYMGLSEKLVTCARNVYRRSSSSRFGKPYLLFQWTLLVYCYGLVYSFESWLTDIMECHHGTRICASNLSIVCQSSY
jgi:hypothetical protein